jgi:hypothetical protein
VRAERGIRLGAFLLAGDWRNHLVPLVGSDNFAFSECFLFCSLLELRYLCARREREVINFEREDPHMIVVPAAALWRAGTSVAGLPEIILGFAAKRVASVDRAS